MGNNEMLLEREDYQMNEMEYKKQRSEVAEKYLIPDEDHTVQENDSDTEE